MFPQIFVQEMDGWAGVGLCRAGLYPERCLASNHTRVRHHDKKIKKTIYDFQLNSRIMEIFLGKKGRLTISVTFLHNVTIKVSH